MANTDIKQNDESNTSSDSFTDIIITEVVETSSDNISDDVSSVNIENTGNDLPVDDDILFYTLHESEGDKGDGSQPPIMDEADIPFSHLHESRKSDGSQPPIMDEADIPFSHLHENRKSEGVQPPIMDEMDMPFGIAHELISSSPPMEVPLMNEADLGDVPNDTEVLSSPLGEAGFGVADMPIYNRDPIILASGDDENIFNFQPSPIKEGTTLDFELPADYEKLTPEEISRRKKLLNDKRIQAQYTKVYEAIDVEYARILESDVSVNKDITDWAQNLLYETRFIIMNYRIDDIPKAEWNIQQIRARLDRAKVSMDLTWSWGIPIIGWAILWFSICTYFIFNPNPLFELLGLNLTNDIYVTELLVKDIFLRAMLFGGIGGVASVIFNLLRFTSKRAYDTEFTLSYLTKPFMGMIVGSLIYLIVFVLMRLLGITPRGIDISSIEEGSKVVLFVALTWGLAAFAGFKEDLFFDLLRRTLKTIFRDTPSKDHTPKSESPSSIDMSRA